jgi:hypothetical protein
MIVPKSLNYSGIKKKYPELSFLEVDNESLSSYENFNRFKINPYLYRHFSNFEFILFYELDAFIFRDDLEEWCSKNYDYVGAPWIKTTPPEGFKFEGVGNGGFSLRKISSMIRVTNSYKNLLTKEDISTWYNNKNWKGKIRYFPELLIQVAGLRNNSMWRFNAFMENEDFFWGKLIPTKFKWYKVPDPIEAIQFSFELHPRHAFQINNLELPVGCHAWWKFDLAFWTPFIESYGFTINQPNTDMT